MDLVAGQVVLPVFSDDVVDVDDQLGGDMVIVVLVAVWERVIFVFTGQ